MRQKQPNRRSEMSHYDAWKLASPYDDEPDRSDLPDCDQYCCDCGERFTCMYSEQHPDDVFGDRADAARDREEER
jgi:hypothetical protein